MLLMVGVQTLAAVLAPAAKASQTLSAIKKRGHVACGVAEGAVGFSEVGRSGKWSGLDIEFCRAVAAGVLGDPDKVAFVPLVTAKRIQAVRSGEVDLLASSSGWTLSRDAGEGVRFVAALYHESQALLVRRKQNITSALELSGSTVCVLEGSRDADNVDSYFRGKGMTYKVMAQATWSELVRSFALGQCTALTSDRTRLAFERARLGPANDYVLLPEAVAHDPLGPVVRADDQRWFAIVRWVLFALIAAEEQNIGMAKPAQRGANGGMPGGAMMLGAGRDLGNLLGLAPTWADEILKKVGNYAEVYERTLGAASSFRLPRGLNALQRDGGLMWAPPFR